MSNTPPQQRGGQAIDLILRDCCECDRPEKYDVDTVELRVSDLRLILERHITSAPPAPSVGGWVELTDEDRERAMRSMPDMLEGFMKTWGWLHYAKAIEAICREKNALPQPPKEKP